GGSVGDDGRPHDRHYDERKIRKRVARAQGRKGQRRDDDRAMRQEWIAGLRCGPRDCGAERQWGVHPGGSLDAAARLVHRHRCDYRFWWPLARLLDQAETWAFVCHRKRVFGVSKPPSRFAGDQLDFRAEWKRKVRGFVSGWEIHQDRAVEVGQQVKQEILELVFLAPINRE